MLQRILILSSPLSLICYLWLLLCVQENDVPDAAVSKLFTSSKRQFNEYGAIAPCLQKLPSEGQMKVC